MSPHVPRKRLRSNAPSAEGKVRGLPFAPRKMTLFDNLDATATPPSSTTAESTAQLIGDSDSSSLSSLSDADFEDVPLAKKRRLDTGDGRPSLAEGGSDDGEDDGDDDEDLEFEDVQAPSDTVVIDDDPVPSGDLELTLTRDTRIPLTNALNKKGPSKLERRIRVSTHCAHVQFLLWHNAVRNAWLCDPEVQGLLLSHLPPKIWDEVDRWRRSSGLEIPEDTPEKPAKARNRGAVKGKRGETGDTKSRDWGEAAQKLEKGAVNLSHGDPLYRLMKVLCSWWKQRFRTTAPGLRKVGYMSLERLDHLTKAHRSGEHDHVRLGERINDLREFRRCAQNCTGSRDVGAQLFTALLRALGLDARMVASLQPLGFGWNRLEDADPEKEDNSRTLDAAASGKEPPAGKKPPASGLSIIEKEQQKAGVSKNRAEKQAPAVPGKRPSRARGRQNPEAPIELELPADDSDDDLAEIPQVLSQKKSAVYDKDLEFPHYWTEVQSPVTRAYLPVEPMLKPVVATNRELVESFEPRGGKADKARQVMAYVVGFSSDGTAKDVTVRYLRRQMLPGRTKGVRMPIEKIPVRGHTGKVKRHDQFDWFREVMRGYGRGCRGHPITESDEVEDSTDLKPARPEKKEVKEGEETLQYYKQSQELVLERHLKREEALVATADPVKVFKNKGKGGVTNEEPVFSRKDVVQVKSAETWHKQGRVPRPGAQPLKKVPYRAATTNRRREIAEAEAATGEKVLQGLYSIEQTEWIIPPPIQNGIIPKNEYGNIDLFVENMCPEGAVHVPYRGAVRVCKRLGVDYAEAVVDFEFGHRMAVPVIQGVVVAAEHHDRVMEELAKDEAERSRKEDEKRRKAALAMWRKFLMGMRIIERIRQDYGDTEANVDVFGRDHEAGDAAGGGEEMAGGFLPDGYESGGKEPHQVSGFFPVADEEDDEDNDDDDLEQASGKP